MLKKIKGGSIYIYFISCFTQAALTDHALQAGADSCHQSIFEADLLNIPFGTVMGWGPQGELWSLSSLVTNPWRDAVLCLFCLLEGQLYGDQRCHSFYLSLHVC